MFPISIDPTSFFIGFATATAFWWLIARARPLWNEVRTTMREQSEASHARRTSNVEENHRRITLRRAQGMHLAAPLFALDEIVQEPRLIAPPPVIEPGGTIPTEDVVAQALPYMPAWPELAGLYCAATLTLPEALAGGRNLVVLGHAGSGKTVALAHLASLCANRHESLGKLQDFVPFLLHVADLKLPAHDARDAIGSIVSSAEEQAAMLDLPRIPGFVRSAFKGGHALLILDGFDELAPEGQKTVGEFLKLLLQEYPAARIVTTGSFESLGDLLPLGFAPVAMNAWSTQRGRDFVQRWGELWTRYVGLEAWAQSGPEQVDPLLINAWLVATNKGLSALELTLKVWGAYAGDSLGPHVLEAIATHIRRLAPANMPLAAMETLAMQVVLNAQPMFDPRGARAWVRSFETTEEDEGSEVDEAEAEAARARNKERKTQRKVAAPSSSLLGRMASSGLLVTHPTGRMRFAHAVIGGYLAGRALSGYNASETILNQPDWSGRTLSLRYLAAHGDVGRILDRMLEWSRLPMHRPLINAGRWLRDAPRTAAWRDKLMAALATLLQTEGLPLSLRGQAMAAFAISLDPSSAALFRQLMGSLSFQMIQLCALGAGFLEDGKAVKVLENLLEAPSLSSRRAACLGLVSIGTTESLEVVVRALLSGDEELRRAAAEALAIDHAEGHPILRDGATHQDILVRRAAVYGLARVGEAWAQELLQTMQVDDDQWVVRNSASEVLESLANPSVRAPRILSSPSTTPWLIEFAGKQGVGIPPGSAATDILLSALKSENEDTRLAALAYLKQTPTEGIVTQIYQAMFKDDSELREAAFQALWEIGASGVKLPDPVQFGAV
jgi:HEAT repeat protein